MRRAPLTATVALLLGAPAALTAQANETVYAIRNATVVPVSGPRIPNGVVVIRGTRIEAVGAGIAIPPEATVLDGSGLYVYPGLIDAGTQVGLYEIGSVPGSVDTRELGAFNPHNDALTAVNAHSEHVRTTRVNGVTTVITAPGGSLVSGSAALIDLRGWTVDEMAVLHRAGMVVEYPRLSGGGGRFGRPAGGEDPAAAANRQVQQLHDYFRTAKAYEDSRARLAAQGRSPAKLDLPMEAMLPVIRRELPVIVDADDEGQIRGAIALADSFGVRVIVRGASEGWRLADTLAARNIPVIVGPTTRSPGGDDPYDMIYANPGVLARAGVTVAFQTSSVADSRNLPFNAALATAYGLDADAALAAVTLNPARIFGVADRLGSIEAGKQANLIVTTGDPLDVRTQVRELFIRGERQPLSDRHTELYEKFRGRPKP